MGSKASYWLDGIMLATNIQYCSKRFICEQWHIKKQIDKQAEKHIDGKHGNASFLFKEQSSRVNKMKETEIENNSCQTNPEG